TPFHRLTRPLAHAFYRWSDAIVGYGSHVKRHLEMQGIDGAKIFVAPHATDNAPYARPVEPGRLDEIRGRLRLGDRPVVLYVGRLTGSKGTKYLMEAMARLSRPEAVLLLLGSGEDRPELERRAGRADLSGRVVFGGFVPNGELYAYYALAQVFVLP